MAARRRPPALDVGEPETARTELLSADAILFLERVNDVTRLLVDPARDGHDEELQHVGKRRHTGRASQRLSAVTNVATRRASSVESARRTASIGFLDSTGSRYALGRGIHPYKSWGATSQPSRPEAERRHSRCRPPPTEILPQRLAAAAARRCPTSRRLSRRMIRHAVLITVAVAVLRLLVLGPPVQAQDKPSAQELADLRVRAEAGEADAQVTLGRRYATGEGVPQDDAKAITWFRKAAEQGHAEAQAVLGAMYEIGRDVPQNDVEAVAWYRNAAEQGHAWAQGKLGSMYKQGRGVPQDDGEAVTWYRKAAEQGNAEAQNSLGVMYDNGEGVPQDNVEAVAWYRRAADQGHTDAQARMEQMRAEQRFLQQQATPGSEDNALLFQAKSIKCEWGQGTIASWNEGRPFLEQGGFGKDAGIVFDSIDTQAGTARIIGNAAAGDISVVVTQVGLTFIEQATFGGLNFTTVFAHFVEPENVALAAVTSRHLGFGSPFPSQYHGTCVILQ